MERFNFRQKTFKLLVISSNYENWYNNCLTRFT
jgi:hypothetical protein